MKYVLGIVLFCWLMCGIVGAWMLDDLDADHWRMIVKGAITLNDALAEHPVTLSGGN